MLVNLVKLGHSVFNFLKKQKNEVVALSFSSSLQIRSAGSLWVAAVDLYLRKLASFKT